MKYTNIFSLILICSLGFTGCKIADLGGATVATDTEAKGRELLQNTYEKMGYDQLAATEVYAVTAHFTWSPVWSTMPMNALPGNKGKDVRLRFATNTFDGQLEFLEGRRKGRIEGLQSWENYRRDNATAAAKTTGSKRFPWGLATYHYLTEAPFRLLGADVVRYAGQTDFDGRRYDLVFATWGDGTDRKNYDQWLLYINRETGFTDLAEVTITDFFLPMPNGMKNATVRYSERAETSIGAHLPTTTVIQLGRPKEDLEKDVYTFTYRDFTFDDFPRKQLYPLAGLPEYGDSKPER